MEPSKNSRDVSVAVIVLGFVAVVGILGLLFLDSKELGSQAGYTAIGTNVGVAVGALAMYVKS